MKKQLIGISIAALALGFGASTALGAIIGSKHDFSGTAWSGGQICVVCHIPHGAATTGLLWSHADSTQATYTLYGGATNFLNAVPGQPSGISKLCLGCHDGTVAIDDYTGTPTATPGTLTIDTFGTGSAQIGGAGDLASTHPISINYNSAYDAGAVNGDPGLKAKTSSFGIDFGTIEGVLEGGTTLQCSTCHDVHNTTGEAVASTALLRDNIAGSAICLGCHIK